MEFLHRDRQLFKDVIDVTVYQTGVSAAVVEKDYYVTMILKYLAEKFDFIVFKGGTSLSKCHKVIERFSEDIDLTIDTSLTQGQKKMVKAAIVEIVELMGLEIVNQEDIRSRRDYNCYAIAYNSVLPSIVETVQPTVLVETSYIAVSFPTNVLKVGNYIGETLEEEAQALVEKYSLAPFEMKVQGIDRTLVDKVFALCDYYLLDNVKKHSRHIYDIYKLLPLIAINDEYKALVEEVRAIREKSSVCPSARNEVDISSILKEMIDLAIYKDDYENLTEKLLEEKVTYEMAITALKKLAELYQKECL